MTPEKIGEILDSYFPNPEIPLDHSDGFTMLCAVVLSAQCTDQRVNEVTPALFQLAPTPQAMAAQPWEAIEEIIRPCGISKNKAKALVSLSQMLVDHHQGKVPDTFEALEALPGVGHKTASVVMSQVHGKPAFAVDTHIHRCAKRWGLSSGKNVDQTEKDLKRLFPKHKWNLLHLQIIYFARAYCPARGHNEEECPICRNL